MHSTLARGNGLFALLSSCMMALLAAIALSSFLFSADPTGTIDITSLKVSVARRSRQRDILIHPRYHANERRYTYRKQELAFVNFNITAGKKKKERKKKTRNHSLVLSIRSELPLPLEHKTVVCISASRAQQHSSSRRELSTYPTHYAKLRADATHKDENAIVIWDRIIRRKEDAHINIAGKNKYMLRELSSSFKSVTRSREAASLH